MTFISKSNKTSEKIEDLYITLSDIEVISGTFTRGTILKKIGTDSMRGDDFQDFEGNKLLETRLCSNKIVPISEAYKLFEPIKR